MPSTLQRLHLPVTTRKVDSKNLTVDIVASTPSVDSYNTIIDQNGWDVDQFKRNPVITWAHDDRGFTASEGLPIARAIPESIKVENGQLKMRLQFTPEDVHPFGFRVFKLIEAGFLNATSVGFDPGDEADTAEGVRIYRNAKLLEVAVVTIPSNDDALIQRARQLNREAEVPEIKALVEEVEKMAEEQKPEETTEEVKVEEVKPEEKVEEKPEEVKVEPVATPEEEKRASEYVQKCISYFEKKQPANKAATRVLKKWYQMRGDEPPADEATAWKNIEEKLDEKPAEVPVEAPVEVKAEEKPAEVEEKPVETKEEPTKPSPIEPVVEAPQPERKASVQIPLPVLLSMREGMVRTLEEARVEALRNGYPLEKMDGLLSALAEKLGQSISHSS